MATGDTPVKSSDDLAQDRTDMAEMRTILAADRTLMAWTRTSVSMISFGFTLFKFFQYFREAEHLHQFRLHGPRNIAMLLIGVGVIALGAAAVQHVQFLQKLGVAPKRSVRSLSFIIAVFVALIGVIAFLNITR